jgi:hypothetical protein
MIAADSKANLSQGERNGEEDNAESSVDEGRGAHGVRFKVMRRKLAI